MRRILSASLLIGTLAAGAAYADEAPNQSRGFQLARRVATLENQKDVPSRAMWLSTRVVKNSRELAFHQEEAPKARAKKPASTVTN